jgi:hypothetical protein
VPASDEGQERYLAHRRGTHTHAILCTSASHCRPRHQPSRRGVAGKRSTPKEAEVRADTSTPGSNRRRQPSAEGSLGRGWATGPNQNGHPPRWCPSLGKHVAAAQGGGRSHGAFCRTVCPPCGGGQLAQPWPWCVAWTLRPTNSTGADMDTMAGAAYTAPLASFFKNFRRSSRVTSHSSPRQQRVAAPTAHAR